MNERKVMAAFAMAMGMICALMAAFWRLARTSSVDQALVAGGTVFVAVVTLAFIVLAYLGSD
ncbi:hypothetical protein ACIA74_35345 [Streptomyces sp. NPDC051658]|uniref:hypothetical protein n=1 Tax=unclassified Streptomyces TaxID=2593676 RepID=UPI00224D4CEF|nr:hypothetical protein [Streptomyces sp. NBC_01363]MCX4734724.1 hypothetical protein [Streptomyces sp. NBC_01363]WSX27933.1 hypothetical protein OG520_12765 [Streptomyces sp. NBC_00984]